MRSTIKAYISKSLIIIFFIELNLMLFFFKNIKIQKNKKIKNKIYGQENQKCKEKIRD